MLRRTVPVVAGVLALVVALFVLAANREWAPFVVPSAPWSARPRLVTLEVQVWALVVASFAAGVVATALLVGTKRGRRRAPPEEGPWPTDRDRLA